MFQAPGGSTHFSKTAPACGGHHGVMTTNPPQAPPDGHHAVATFDPAVDFVHIDPDGAAHVVAASGHGHPDLPGLVIGAAAMTDDAPHGGEYHPDGDELLFVITGEIHVFLDGTDQPTIVGAGQAAIVPRATWHRVHVVRPTRLIHLTPGPHSRIRPRPSATT